MMSHVHTICLLDVAGASGPTPPWTGLVIFLGGLLVGAAAAILILWRVILPRKVYKETEQLAHSVEWMKDIFDASADGMAIINKDLRILNINQQQKRWFPNADAGKICYKEFRSRDQKAPCESCPVLKAIETGEPHTITVQSADARGWPHWHEVLASPLHDKHGKTIAAVEMVRDVTALNLAEAAQDRLNEHLRQTHEMVENVSDSVIGSDRDRVITMWNKGAEQIFGYTAKEVKGKKAPMLYPEDEQEKMAGLVARALEGETIRNVEVRAARKDGAFIDLLTTLFPLKDSKGEIVGISGISKDITEQKRLEEQVRSQKELQDNLIENANVIIIGCGLNGKLMILNKKAEKSTGYAKDELLGKEWIPILVPAENREAFQKIIESACDESFPTTCECPITTKVGICRQIIWHNSVLRDKAGAVSGIICIGEEHPDEPVSTKLQL